MNKVQKNHIYLIEMFCSYNICYNWHFWKIDLTDPKLLNGSV